MPASERRNRRVLVLGGTGEARTLADALAGRGYDVTTSLAGRTAAPLLPAGTVRSGGFGGAEGLASYLQAERFALLVDATHPFAVRMRANAVQAAAAGEVPLLRLERPAWTPQHGDRWIEVDSLEAAAAAVPGIGRRAFLTVGAGELAPFAAIPAVWFLVRLVDAPASPLPLRHCRVVLARGPFPAAEEELLLRTHRIDLVVSKNSGGAATYGKIEAARRLGLPVVLVTRTAVLEAATTPTVADAAAALGWIEAQLGTR